MSFKTEMTLLILQMWKRPHTLENLAELLSDGYKA